MATWERYGDLMLFRELDNATVPALTLAFRFTDNGNDPWTARLNRFKSGHANAIQSACQVFPVALSTVRFNHTPVVLTCAIPSAAETLPAECALASLGAAVAARLSWAWQPKLLRKRAHRSLHFLSGSAERDAEVAGAYQAGTANGAGTIVILDDFITRGTTLGEAARSLRAANPDARIVGVGLGKTERQSWANDTNAHVPERYATQWG